MPEIEEPCLLCGGKDHFVVIDEPYRIIQCKNCSFIFKSPKPTRDELSQYYSHGESSTHQIDQRLRERSVMHRIKYLSKMVDLAKVQSLLDIGCDDGLFLNEVKKNCPWIEPFGVEPSEKRAELARKYYGLQNIITGFFEETKFKRSFDLITGFHILEHLYNPIEFLQKVKSIMSPHSLLLLEVPTVSLSRLDLPFGIKLLAPGYTKSPEHLWFFTSHALQYLLELQNFHILRMKCITFGIQPSVNSLVMKHMPKLFPLYEEMSKAILFPFNHFGQGLQIAVIASTSRAGKNDQQNLL